MDFEAADQGADDLAPGEPIGGFEPVLHLCGEILQATNHQPQLTVHSG
jgi:hypothetical protein